MTADSWKANSWKINWINEWTRATGKTTRINQQITEAMKNGVIYIRPAPEPLAYHLPPDWFPETLTVDPNLNHRTREELLNVLLPRIFPNLTEWRFLPSGDVATNDGVLTKYELDLIMAHPRNCLKFPPGESPITTSVHQMHNWIQRRDTIINDCASQGRTAEETEQIVMSDFYHYFGIQPGTVAIPLIPFVNPMDPRVNDEWTRLSAQIKFIHNCRRHRHAIATQLRNAQIPYTYNRNSEHFILNFHGTKIYLKPKHSPTLEEWVIDLDAFVDDATINKLHLELSWIPFENIVYLSQYILNIFKLLNPRVNIPLKDSLFEVLL